MILGMTNMVDKRKCLRCGKDFQPVSKTNYICNLCKSGGKRHTVRMPGIKTIKMPAPGRKSLDV